MKIGLVCPYNIERSGGVLEVVLALQEGLTQRGHTVRIITPKPGSSDVNLQINDVIFAGTSIDFRTFSFDTTAQVSSTADAEKIKTIVQSENFDILHFHEPWQPLLSRQLLQYSNAVNIGTFHASVSEAMMSRAVLKVVTPYLKSVLKYLNELTAVSDSGAAYVASITDEPIKIIPNGIDLEKYHVGRKANTEHKTILYIGRLERRKGTKYLLQAYGLLAQNHPDVELLIAGDGPDREKLELLAEDLQLPNVHFLGYISETKKQKLLREADLFCSPALFGESFGIVLLEAMASGTVCVAGHNSGYSGLMSGVGQISLVNPEDIVEFTRRLEMLIYQPELRRLWKSWAKQYVQQFNYDQVVDQYEAFYKLSLERHANR